MFFDCVYVCVSISLPRPQPERLDGFRHARYHLIRHDCVGDAGCIRISRRSKWRILAPEMYDRDGRWNGWAGFDAVLFGGSWSDLKYCVCFIAIGLVGPDM